jgi:uncharacterized protein YdiU (UPF0061 family)
MIIVCPIPWGFGCTMDEASAALVAMLGGASAIPPRHAVMPRNHLVEEAISAAVSDEDFARLEDLVAALARP